MQSCISDTVVSPTLKHPVCALEFDIVVLRHRHDVQLNGQSRRNRLHMSDIFFYLILTSTLISEAVFLAVCDNSNSVHRHVCMQC